jgi:hypothetical protein
MIWSILAILAIVGLLAIMSVVEKWKRGSKP